MENSTTQSTSTYRVRTIDENDLYSGGAYLEKNPSWHEEDSAWKAAQVLRMLAKHSLEPRTICDVGCGAGEVLSELHENLPDQIIFSGYEISPQAYEICSLKEKERLHFQLDDPLHAESQHFDLVLALDVFEHVEDYFGFLRGLKDTGDYKLFHIPLDLSVQRVLLSRPILRRRELVGHIHYFTKETALATLVDTGYEIVDYFYTASTLERPATSLLYALGKLPLKIATLINKDLAVRLLGGHSLLVLAK